MFSWAIFWAIFRFPCAVGTLTPRPLYWPYGPFFFYWINLQVTPGLPVEYIWGIIIIVIFCTNYSLNEKQYKFKQQTLNRIISFTHISHCSVYKICWSYFWIHIHFLNPGYFSGAYPIGVCLNRKGIAHIFLPIFESTLKTYFCWLRVLACVICRSVFFLYNKYWSPNNCLILGQYIGL